MTDYYLKFADEPIMMSALKAANVLIKDMDNDDIVPAYYKGAAIDVVGEIPGVAGWHVNWRGPLPDALSEFIIPVPATPARVWA